MRISDWSSDVCSSDLGVDQAEMKVDAVAHRIDRRLGREAGLPAANARDFAHDLANGDGAVGGGDRIGGGASDPELVGAEFGEHADRKRDGEGKSVAVRVDLGGCRSLKNKHEQITTEVENIEINQNIKM